MFFVSCSHTLLVKALCLVALATGAKCLRDDHDDSVSGGQDVAIQMRASGHLKRGHDHQHHHHHRQSKVLAMGTHDALLNLTGSKADSKHLEAHEAKKGKEQQEDPEAHKQAQDSKEVIGQLLSLRKIFGVCSIICFMLVVTFEIVHMRWSDVDWERKDVLLDSDPATQSDIRRLDFYGFAMIPREYFAGDGKVFGSIIFVLTVAMIVCGAMIEKQMNFVTGVFWDAMQVKDPDKFFQGLCCYLCMVPGAFMISAYRHYIIGMLSIHWRQSLTRWLQRVWLSHCAYSVSQIRAPNEKPLLENPDQRIEVDVPEYVANWLELAFGLLAALPTFFIWMPMVIQLSPDHIFAMKTMPIFKPWLLVLAVSWCMLTSAMTHCMGRSLIILSYASERYRGDFRMGLSRIRNNAEAIATLHAEDHEERSLESYFERIKRIVWEQMHVEKVMRLVGDVLSQTMDLFPLIFLAHAYFTGDVSLGHFMRIRIAVSNIQDSASWFVSSYGTIAHLQACSNRLVEMLSQCEKIGKVRLLQPKLDDNTDMPSDRGGGRLKLTSAKGRLPNGALLWSIEDLEIEEGMWTLVQGSEGTGKSTLLRLLAGAWPVQDGTELRISGVPKPSSTDGPSDAVEALKGTDSNGDCAEASKESEANDVGDKMLADALKSSNLTEDGGEKPPKGTMLFVPVGAYRLRTGFCLKEAVCYPDDQRSFPDDDVVRALENVGLGKLLVDPAIDLMQDATPPEDGRGCQVVTEVATAPPVLKACYAALHNDHGDRKLSSGEAQRLELAHVLLTRPRWCFLDEPVSHVAEEEKEVLFSAFRSQVKDSTTVITITHDVRALAPLHDVQMELRDGELRRFVKGA